MSVPKAEIITLTHGSTRLDVAPAVGGSIAAYTTQTVEGTIHWLRPASAQAIAACEPHGLACFPLVPFSNRIRGGKFELDGRTISLRHALHGDGWKNPWSVAEQGTGRLAIEYRHPQGDWPFPYRARQVFDLADRGLSVTIEIANHGESDMPCGLGLHPYFVRTPQCRIVGQIDQMWETDEDLLPVRLVEPPPAADPRRGVRPAETALDNVFTGWPGEARIEWPEERRALLMRASEPLCFLVIYSPKGEDYFCVEPVSNATDAFNQFAQGRTDSGTIVLKPGETVSATVSFEPSFD